MNKSHSVFIFSGAMIFFLAMVWGQSMEESIRVDPLQSKGIEIRENPPY